MPDHQTPLIATIAAGLMLAFILGLIAHRLRVQPLVGYLLAGVMVGPYTPGFEADPALASELAEIGVILLMFGVGLHFSLKDLLSVARIAVPGAIGQIVVATLMGAGLCPGRWAGRTWRASSSALPCRSPARSCWCAPCRTITSSRRRAGASRSAGWWSRTSPWCWRWCCCRRSPP